MYGVEELPVGRGGGGRGRHGGDEEGGGCSRGVDEGFVIARRCWGVVGCVL